jgi:aspartate aminotransferase
MGELSHAPASRRAAGMVPSEIRQLMELADACPGAIRLEVGQPDFPTPEHVVAAADAAARGGHTGYAPNAGLAPLREALAAKLAARNGYAPAPEQVLVTNGATSGVFTTLQAVTDPGDELLLPDPTWPTFRMMAAVLGLRVRPYALRAEHDYEPDPDELAALIGPRTRALLLVSPSNPLGVVLGPQRAAAIAELAQRHGVWTIADEVYDEIVFDGAHTSVAAVAPYERLISVYSCSKVYAMCGWRVGYIVAPPSLAPLLAALQEPVTSSINTPAQHAALAAVTGPQEPVARMRDAYRARRDRAFAELERRDLRAVRPAGAFYVWVDVARAGMHALELSHTLLRERGVAVAPGSAFGATGDQAIRISLAAGEDDVVAGIGELADFCAAAAAVG